jgi:hypothetical protein
VFNSRQQKNIFLFTKSKPDLGPTQPPIQWVPGVLSPGIKQPCPEADYLLLSSAEVKNVEAIYQLPHMSSWRGPFCLRLRVKPTQLGPIDKASVLKK